MNKDKIMIVSTPLRSNDFIKEHYVQGFGRAKRMPPNNKVVFDNFIDDSVAIPWTLDKKEDKGVDDGMD